MIVVEGISQACWEEIANRAATQDHSRNMEQCTNEEKNYTVVGQSALMLVDIIVI